jgi:hypothetical protein
MSAIVARPAIKIAAAARHKPRGRGPGSGLSGKRSSAGMWTRFVGPVSACFVPACVSLAVRIESKLRAGTWRVGGIAIAEAPPRIRIDR